MKELTNVSMSRKRVAQRFGDLKQQASGDVSAFDFYFIVCDESTDATDTTQLLMFCWEFLYILSVTAKLIDLKSLKAQRLARIFLKGFPLQSIMWDSPLTNCEELERMALW